MDQTQAVALNADWLSPTTTVNAVALARDTDPAFVSAHSAGGSLTVSGQFLDQTTTTNVSTFPSGGSYWWPNYLYYVPEHRPIKLGLSEVERLRAAAKKDVKLKAILAKFTDQIEVVVDFE